MEQVVFVVIALALTGAPLFLSYKKNHTLYGVLFILSLALSMAFYLFQFGELARFTLEGLDTKLEFIREKRTQAEIELEKLTKIEAEVASKATQIDALVTEIRQTETDLLLTNEHLLTLAMELDGVAKMAAPNRLILKSAKTEESEIGYRKVLHFAPSKDTPLGRILLAATVPKGSNGKLIEFRAGEGTGVHVGGNEISDSGGRAQLAVNPMGGSDVWIVVETDGPAPVEISGNHGFEAIELIMGE